MSAKSKYSSSAAIVVFMIMVGILIFLFMTPFYVSEELLTGTTNYSNTVLSISPGLVATGEAMGKVKEINFPDFELDNTLDSREQVVSSQYTIQQGVFSSNKADFAFRVDSLEGFEGAEVKFLTSSKQGTGDLSLSLNGKVVQTSSSSVGEEVTIVLPDDQIIAGQNTIQLAVSSPGLAFWSSNEYLLSNIRVVVSGYPDDATTTQTFTLSANELVNAESAVLTAYIRQKSASSTNMHLSLNGNTLYQATPPSAFSVELPIDRITAGANTFEWSIDRDGDYEFRFVKLDLETTSISEGEKQMFTIKEADYRRSNSTLFDCELYVLRESGSDTINVKINEHNEQYSFTGSEIRTDVCDFLNSGANEILISAPERLVVDTLSLTIRRA